MRRAIAVLVLLVVTLPANGGEPTRIEVSPDEIPVGQPEWFGLYLTGKKSGYARMELSQVGDRFVSEMRMVMKILAMGRRSDMEMRWRSEFEAKPPYRFVGGSTSESLGEGIKTITVTNGPEKIVAVVSEGGAERKITRAAPDYTLLDEVTTTLWVRGEPEPGRSVTVRSYDVEELEMDLHTFVLERVIPTAVSGVRTVYFEGKVSSEKAGDMGTVRLSATGSLLSWMLGGNVELRAEPEELAKKISYSSDLFVKSLVKIDKPLGEPTGVERLVVEAKGEGAKELESGPRQRVEREDGKTVLHLGEGEPVAATPEDLEKCVSETVDYPAKHERVVALMKEAVGDATEPEAKVERLVKFVSDYVEDAIDANATSVHRVIEGKKGDCTEHALLFTCLARAAGIPTREVTGIMYMGDEVKAFGSHAWNEVVLGGRWVPVDATWNETVADAAHIRLGHGDRGDLAFLRVMGKLELRLREVKRRPASGK